MKPIVYVTAALLIIGLLSVVLPRSSTQPHSQSAASMQTGERHVRGGAEEGRGRGAQEDAKLGGRRAWGSKGGGARKVKLHRPTAEANPRGEPITFDPLVAQLEQRQDDRAWEQSYEKKYHHEHHVRAGHHHEHHHSDPELNLDLHAQEDAEMQELLHEAGADHVDDDTAEHLDLDQRLDTIFPLIDVDPIDNHISLPELTYWELQQTQRVHDHRLDRELEALDLDGDGRVTLKEYLQEEEDQVKPWIEREPDAQPYYRLEMAKFEIVDADGDGYLERNELHEMLHPEDSEDPRMKQIVVENELRNRDEDGDMKLSVREFLDHVWPEVYDMELDAEKWAKLYQPKPFNPRGGPPPRFEQPPRISPQEKESMGRLRFHRLDENQDGFLQPSELQAVMHILQPGEYAMAEYSAKHMLGEADVNRDGYLTLDEMKAHKEAFYNTAREDVFEESQEDDVHAEEHAEF